ncbi:hypothetical protein D3C76_271220 [compost metagenome]
MGVANSITTPSNSHIINYCTLINYKNQKFDITQVMQKMIIYEDLIDRGYQHGTISMLDDNALHLNLPIVGEEWLEVSFKTRLDGGFVGKDEFVKKYKITSINDLSKQKDNNNQVLVLNFVSEGYWLSETHLFSKSYAQTLTSDLVTDLMEQGLGLKIDVEPTLYPRDWVIPNIQAFDFIMRLTNESTSKDNLSSDYRFYENIDGFHFKSLYTLAQADFKQRLNANVDNVTDYDRLKADEHKKDVHFDIERQARGGLQVTIDELDTIQKRTIRSQLDYSGYRTAFKGMNPAPLYLGELDYPTDMYYRISSGNQAYQANRETDINQRVKRVMNRALMAATQCTVKIPGNIDLKLGDTVYFDFNFNGTIDQTTSGKYLICKIKHEIAQNDYFMTVNIRKDSNIQGEKVES